MASTIPEDLKQEIGRGIRDLRLLAEAFRRSHEDRDLKDANHTIEILQCVVHRRKRIQECELRCFLGLLDRDVRADLSGIQVALARLGHVPADISDTIMNDDRRVSIGRRLVVRKFVAVVGELG